VFLRCLADRFGLEVNLELDGSVRLYTLPPIREEDIDCTVPNVIQIANDGSVVPVDYELKNEEEDSVL
jgi:pentose-5-phosphate-3-epimerase